MLSKIICLVVLLCSSPIVVAGPNCPFSADVTCRLKSDNSDCEELTVGQPGTCGPTNVTYTYSYCNLDSTNTINFTKPTSYAYMDMTNVTGNLTYTPLPANTCRNKTFEYTGNSCRGFYGYIQGTGFIGPNAPGTGNGCFDKDFFRTVICTVSAAVDCVTGPNQEPCNKTRVTATNCTTVTATYYYTYCNLNSDPSTGKVNLNNNTYGKINEVIVNATDFSQMSTQTCRTFEKSATVNTCNNFFSGSMKTEGTIANVIRYQYCYDYNFIKFKPLINSDPAYNYTQTWCDVRASISCKRKSDGLPCNSIVASDAVCGPTNVTYNFTMYNANTKYYNITLNQRTFYAISGLYTPVLPNTTFLNGTKSISFIVTTEVDTCNNVLPSQFKVEGTLDKAPKYTYCYAFKFYKFSPLRPSAQPTKSPAGIPPVATANPTTKPTAAAFSGCLTPVPGEQGNCPANYRCDGTNPVCLANTLGVCFCKKACTVDGDCPVGNQCVNGIKGSSFKVCSPIAPTRKPTRQPTSKPSNKPIASPTRKPTRKPTSKPSNKPVAAPTRKPSKNPGAPTRRPTGKPAPVYIKKTYAPKATYAPKVTPVKATYAPKAPV